MKELSESDLKIGDILIFEDFNFDPLKLMEKVKEGGAMGGAYYLLHYLIAWFDPGKEGDNYRNIYHAGIWGNVDINRDTEKAPQFKDCVVQAGTNGIGHASLAATLAHETVMNVYVCRLKETPDNFEADINNSIRDFYKAKGHYSFKTAWLLAAICSMRYTKSTLYEVLRSRFGNAMAHYLVGFILIKINEYNNHHQRDMVACSPLVAMMYKNAGHELPVHVFEALKPQGLPKTNFDLQALEGNIPHLSSSTEDWPTMKETVVTPRQLMESPSVEVIGVMKHKG